MRHQIQVLDPVWATMNGEAAQLLNNTLSFTRKDWGGGRISFTTIRMIESVGGGKYLFPNGLINRALNALDELGEDYELIGALPEYFFNDPYIKGVDYRHYQKRLIDAGLQYGRGVLKAPTATGKSYIILGLMAAFSKENILFLCHTKDLVRQMKNHLVTNGFKNIGEWTGDTKDLQRITVATVQSYVNLAEEHVRTWDVIIIDEGHHVSTLEGQYVKILSLSAAPVKLALTATLPYIEEAKMALEAYVGPLLAEYTIQEAGEDNVLAIPKIEIITIPPMPYDILLDVSDFNPKKIPSDYQIVYRNGIVHNVTRNLRILQEAERFYNRGESVLINVVQIAHGEILQEMARDHYKFPVTFVHGEVDNRDEILAQFEKKEIQVVIATKVFNEGVNIESLNAVINAAGGKSEIETLQKIGRGLRKKDGKEFVTIIDFHDMCHDMLEKHYFARYRMYLKNGWIKKKKEEENVRTIGAKEKRVRKNVGAGKVSHPSKVKRTAVG